MKEKKNWEETRFTKHVRITEEHHRWLTKNKKEGGISVTLEEIINKECLANAKPMLSKR